MNKRKKSRRRINKNQSYKRLIPKLYIWGAIVVLLVLAGFFIYNVFQTQTYLTNSKQEQKEVLLENIRYTFLQIHAMNIVDMYNLSPNATVDPVLHNDNFIMRTTALEEMPKVYYDCDYITSLCTVSEENNSNMDFNLSNTIVIINTKNQDNINVSVLIDKKSDLEILDINYQIKDMNITINQTKELETFKLVFEELYGYNTDEISLWDTILFLIDKDNYSYEEDLLEIIKPITYQ
jgi:hypothetical protein